MSDRQFDYFRNLAMTAAGIKIADFKRNMVYRRVSRRLTANNLTTFDTYIKYLQQNAEEVELFVNALTTNKTGFFREPHHFEHLSNIMLPAVRSILSPKQDRSLRIWSAGCSSGQEAYSIAMTILESAAELANWNSRILATDIDTDVVRYGSAGIYSQEDVETLGAARLNTFFNRVDDEHWGVKDDLRRLIVFNKLNLHGDWPIRRRFDAIFCRNVIIYFDKPAQRKLFDRFANVMKEGAYLYIGHSESLFNVTDRFEPAGQSVYRKIA
jgi:chemotaxis protein methyltransferase CheR